MNRNPFSGAGRSLLAWAPRALILVLALAAPVLAAPAALGEAPRSVIEAPRPAKTGMGFVLLMSLRRS